MAIYIVRVELHNVPKDKSEKVYKDLHDRMAEKNFVRQVSNATGTYDLPIGLYINDKADYLGDAHLVDGLAWVTAYTGDYPVSTSTIAAPSIDDFHWSGLAKSKK